MESKTEVPAAFYYLLTKAKIYLCRGPERYRKDDAFNMPPSSVTDGDLVILQSAMEQLVAHKGIAPELPLNGLEIPGFYLLMETMHFKPLQQRVHHRTEDLFIDEMTMAHVMTGQQITLYNAVGPIRA